MDSWQFLELVGPIGVLAGVAALAIHGVQLRNYRQRLRAEGFEADDLKSAASINKKWAQIIVERLPAKIEFKNTDSHLWSDEPKHQQCEVELVQSGFTRIGVFVATPQHWTAELWVSSSLDAAGIVLDSRLHGPYLDLMTWYRDGSHVSFSNCPNSGLCEPDAHHVYCGYIHPRELIAIWLRDRSGGEMKKPNRESAVALYQEVSNEHLEQHRKNGISGDAIRRHFEFRSRIKKGQRSSSNPRRPS